MTPRSFRSGLAAPSNPYKKMPTPMPATSVYKHNATLAIGVRLATGQESPCAFTIDDSTSDNTSAESSLSADRVDSSKRFLLEKMGLCPYDSSSGAEKASTPDSSKRSMELGGAKDFISSAPRKPGQFSASDLSSTEDDSESDSDSINSSNSSSQGRRHNQHRNSPSASSTNSTGSLNSTSQSPETLCNQGLPKRSQRGMPDTCGSRGKEETGTRDPAPEKLVRKGESATHFEEITISDDDDDNVSNGARQEQVGLNSMPSGSNACKLGLGPFLPGIAPAAKKQQEDMEERPRTDVLRTSCLSRSSMSSHGTNNQVLSSDYIEPSLLNGANCTVEDIQDLLTAAAAGSDDVENCSRVTPPLSTGPHGPEGSSERGSPDIIVESSKIANMQKCNVQLSATTATGKASVTGERQPSPCGTEKFSPAKGSDSSAEDDSLKATTIIDDTDDSESSPAPQSNVADFSDEGHRQSAMNSLDRVMQIMREEQQTLLQSKSETIFVADVLPGKADIGTERDNQVNVKSESQEVEPTDSLLVPKLEDRLIAWNTDSVISLSGQRPEMEAKREPVESMTASSAFSHMSDPTTLNFGSDGNELKATGDKPATTFDVYGSAERTDGHCSVDRTNRSGHKKKKQKTTSCLDELTVLEVASEYHRTRKHIKKLKRRLCEVLPSSSDSSFPACNMSALLNCTSSSNRASQTAERAERRIEKRHRHYVSNREGTTASLSKTAAAFDQLLAANDPPQTSARSNSSNSGHIKTGGWPLLQERKTESHPSLLSPSYSHWKRPDCGTSAIGGLFTSHDSLSSKRGGVDQSATPLRASKRKHAVAEYGGLSQGDCEDVDGRSRRVIEDSSGCNHGQQQGEVLSTTKQSHSNCSATVGYSPQTLLEH